MSGSRRRAAKRWKASIFAFVLISLSPWATVAHAQYIYQRVSFKYILNASGTRPPGVYANPAHLTQVIEDTNRTLDRMGRGYRLVMEPVADVFGATQFYDLTGAEFNTQLQEQAQANVAQYHWRADAINVYVVNSADFAGGAARIPNWTQPGNDVMMWVCGVDPVTSDTRLLHEFGHHNALWHTFETDGKGFTANCPGDDCVGDTRFDPELSCVSLFSCTTGGSFECCCSRKITLLDAAASAGGWTAQEKTWIRWNVMSYFGADDCISAGFPFTWDNMLLTPDQLDRWSDATRRYHAGEVTGLTFFVGGTPGSGTPDGYSNKPYATVLAGVNAATGAGSTHVVNVRGGAYAENLTISAPVTLRASRGAATIGQ